MEVGDLSETNLEPAAAAKHYLGVAIIIDANLKAKQSESSPGA